MKISSIMTRDVVTVEMDDSLQTICEIFNNFEFHHILVLENQKLVGIISDRDLLKAVNPFLDISFENGDSTMSLDKKPHQIMSKTLITVNMETSIEEANDLLLDNIISCLPVISQQGSVEGIVTWKDILRSHFKNIKGK